MWVWCLLLQLSAAAQSGNLEVGDKAIPFEAADQHGKMISLQSQLERGKVIVLFYRGFWCPFCNKQLSDFQDSISLFKAKNAQIIAITPEAPVYVKKTIEKTGAGFKILHDKNYTIMNKYGVAFTLDAAATNRMKKVNIDLAAINENNQAQLPVPAVFIINQQGIIEYVFFNPNYRVRPSVKELLEHL